MTDNREKNALISKARHNLKNPVNAILGFSEMLIEDCEDEGFEDILRIGHQTRSSLFSLSIKFS